jgi:hypothetical protein
VEAIEEILLKDLGIGGRLWDWQVSEEMEAVHPDLLPLQRQLTGPALEDQSAVYGDGELENGIMDLFDPIGFSDAFVR